MGDKVMWQGDMKHMRDSGGDKAAYGWTSDEQEIAAVVEEFISRDMVPTEAQQKVRRLKESGDSHKALRIILDSLD